MYSKKIMDRFLHPKFHKKIKEFNGVGQAGNPMCGDIMKIYINIKDNIIKHIAVETMGCVAAIASSDILCELAKGKTIDEALKITKDDIIKYMGGEVPPIKVHCSILALDALKKAVEDYRNKDVPNIQTLPDSEVKITKGMPLGEIMQKYPEAMGVLFSFGLHCAGCHVADFETLEMGFKAHGMSDEQIDEAVKKINKIVERKESS